MDEPPRSDSSLFDRLLDKCIGVWLWSILLGTTTVLTAATARAEGNAAAGAKVFLTCAVCHSFRPGSAEDRAAPARPYRPPHRRRPRLRLLEGPRPGQRRLG
jgi:hypothetical protein